MTKVSFKLIFAALAATVVLAGCTKEITPGKADQTPASPAAEGTRVITVSFAPQTKTSFSETAGGIEPYFVKGDKIVLCSDIENPTEENTQTCVVDVDDETQAATITTKLTGELTAYYPADLAISGKKGLQIYVPSDQDGIFANANICSATIAENVASTTFNNIYALFVITPPAGTKKLTIKSLRPIGADGQRSVTERPIICGTGEDLYKITVGNGTEEIPSTCYVAMNDGVNLSNLSFEATSDAEGTTGYIKGITTSAIAAAAGTGVAVGSEAYNTCNTVVEGSAYTIDGSNWHEYVTVANRKWATMNIGASESDPNGTYFSWGSVEKVYTDLSNNTFTFSQTNPDPSPGRYTGTWDPESGFNECNTPYYSGNSYSKYTESDKNTVLDLADDAANANWGGAWRIPTGGPGGEFQDLYDATYWAYDSNGHYVFSPKDSYTAGTFSSSIPSGLNESDALLFFPVAGSVHSKLTLETSQGSDYWSSTLSKEKPTQSPAIVYDIHLDSEKVEAQDDAMRHYGHVIRAIVDDPDYIATED